MAICHVSFALDGNFNDFPLPNVKQFTRKNAIELLNLARWQAGNSNVLVTIGAGGLKITIFGDKIQLISSNIS